MTVIIEKSGLSGFGNNKRLEVGESREESVKLGLKHYIGQPCKNRHYIGGFAVRFTCNHNCVLCSRNRVSRVNSTDADTDKCQTRDRIELIKTAKELGVSVEDLM